MTVFIGTYDANGAPNAMSTERGIYLCETGKEHPVVTNLCHPLKDTVVYLLNNYHVKAVFL